MYIGAEEFIWMTGTGGFWVDQTLVQKLISVLNHRSFCINAGLQGRVGKDVEEEESEKEMYKRQGGGCGGM